MNEWIKEFNASITVSDKNGTILEMNDKSCKIFEKDGGRDLIGTSLFDCHPEDANIKIRQLLANKETNIYTIEKNGVKKLIYQAPWFVNSELKGLVELSLEIPFDMPHFLRK